MCVIVYKPENITISAKTLKQMWTANPDGAGILIPDKSPHIVKGIMELSRLSALLNNLNNVALLLHLRVATHGAVCTRYTHPFPCGKSRYLMHNGCLSGYGSPGNKGQSDSAHLASDLRSLSTPATKRLLTALNGKFALCEKRAVTLFGHFTEYEGLSCSNLNFKRYVFTPNATSGTKYAGLSDQDGQDYWNRYALWQDRFE